MFFKLFHYKNFLESFFFFCYSCFGLNLCVMKIEQGAMGIDGPKGEAVGSSLVVNVVLFIVLYSGFMFEQNK